MTDKFYESEVVRKEIKEMETLYTELARLSINYAKLDEEEKLDHINNTLMLIAKQKVFYGTFKNLDYYISYFRSYIFWQCIFRIKNN